MFHHRSSTAKPAGGGNGSAARRNQSKGRLEGKRAGIKKIDVGDLSKKDRMNTLKQARQSKKEELLERRRLGADDNGSDPPPKVVALIGFHTKADALSLKRHILAACGMDVETASKFPPHVPATTLLPPYAQGGAGGGRSRVILIDPVRELLPVMDVAMCADIVLCVVGPEASLEEPSFDEFGYTTLTALKSQGLPVVLGAVHGRSDAMESAKQKNTAMKFVQRYFHSELGAETKLFHAGSDEEVKALIRGLGIVTPKEITWRADRGYLMAQESEYNLNEGTLCLKGYVRGPGLRCKHLVHLTGHGDFQLEKIALLPDPCPARGARRGADAGMADGEKVMDQLDPNAGEDDRPDTIRLRTYDPTMEEPVLFLLLLCGKRTPSLVSFLLLPDTRSVTSNFHQFRVFRIILQPTVAPGQTDLILL
jgi:pre-rRNA-processing protein TSR1